jgi:hypothetical protein
MTKFHFRMSPKLCHVTETVSPKLEEAIRMPQLAKGAVPAFSFIESGD